MPILPQALMILRNRFPVGKQRILPHETSPDEIFLHYLFLKLRPGALGGIERDMRIELASLAWSRVNFAILGARDGNRTRVPSLGS